MTGYEIRRLPDERGRVTFGAFDDGELVTKASGRVEWMALRIVVEHVYKLHSESRCSGPVGVVHAANPAGRCSHIIENIVRTVEPTEWTTWSQFAGIATESFMSWSAQNEGSAINAL
jgi:hypothetical protein